MNQELNTILQRLGEEYRESIARDARNYVEVDLGEKARSLGYDDLGEKYKGANAVIPLKAPVKGMKVRIDGRTFINYGQFESGVAVPGYVARDASLPYKTFVPCDSMILNFA